MKKIVFALFTVVALTSCGGGEKCEGNCGDSTSVDSTAVVATSTVTTTDTTAAAVVADTVK